MNIKIKRLHEDVKLPTRGSTEAACFDLYAYDINSLKDNVMEVSYGISLEIPKGYKAVIVPRSSFTGLGWIMANSPAQIDSDYRGELKSRFQGFMYPKSAYEHAMSRPFPYYIGDRCAQLYIEKVIDIDFIETEELSETERGELGFGSTGK